MKKSLFDLIKASASVEDFKKAIDDGADVNSIVECGKETVLIEATINNRIDIVNLLIEKGADVDKVNYLGLNAYAYALINGFKDLIGVLKPLTKDLTPWRKDPIYVMYSYIRDLSKPGVVYIINDILGTYDDFSILPNYAMYNSLYYLLTSPSNKDKNLVRDIAIRLLKVNEYVGRDDWDKTLLMNLFNADFLSPAYKVILKDKRVLETINERTFAEGNTALIIAAEAHQFDWVKELLKAGADPNIENLFYDTFIEYAKVETINGRCWFDILKDLNLLK